MVSFKKDWFTRNLHAIATLISMFKPRNILEIGSYEGLSAFSFLNMIPGARITCVDPWEDEEVKKRFDSNMAEFGSAVTVIRGYSRDVLPRMIVEGQSFDMVYIDGSHDAPDVLMDSILSFPLCRVSGLMVFDDYLWNTGDVLTSPKIAIDAFSTCYGRKLKIVQEAPIWQLYLEKISN